MVEPSQLTAVCRTCAQPGTHTRAVSLSVLEAWFGRGLVFWPAVV
jgi:hypothetical protein